MSDVDIVEWLIMGVMVVGTAASFMISGILDAFKLNLLGLAFYFSGAAFLFGLFVIAFNWGKDEVRSVKG